MINLYENTWIIFCKISFCCLFFSSFLRRWSVLLIHITRGVYRNYHFGGGGGFEKKKSLRIQRGLSPKILTPLMYACSLYIEYHYINVCKLKGFKVSYYENKEKQPCFHSLHYIWPILSSRVSTVYTISGPY